MKNGKIALGGILTECNEFSINLMTKDNFEDEFIFRVEEK